jgi:hypothetical protein
MACEWAELGLDYLLVYKRTDNWETNWIGKLKIADVFQLNLLEILADRIEESEYDKFRVLELICRQYAQKLNFDKALEIIDGIDSRPLQNTALWYTYGQMAVNDDLKKTIELVNGIEDKEQLCLAYLEIITRLSEFGNNEATKILLLDVCRHVNGINEELELRIQNLEI